MRTSHQSSLQNFIEDNVVLWHLRHYPQILCHLLSQCHLPCCNICYLYTPLWLSKDFHICDSYMYLIVLCILSIKGCYNSLTLTLSTLHTWESYKKPYIPLLKHFIPLAQTLWQFFMRIAVFFILIALKNKKEIKMKICNPQK